jgi:hypothetical protein
MGELYEDHSKRLWAKSMGDESGIISEHSLLALTCSWEGNR